MTPTRRASILTAAALAAAAAAPADAALFRDDFTNAATASNYTTYGTTGAWTITPAASVAGFGDAGALVYSAKHDWATDGHVVKTSAFALTNTMDVTVETKVNITALNNTGGTIGNGQPGQVGLILNLNPTTGHGAMIYLRRSDNKWYFVNQQGALWDGTSRTPLPLGDDFGAGATGTPANHGLIAALTSGTLGNWTISARTDYTAANGTVDYYITLTDPNNVTYTKTYSDLQWATGATQIGLRDRHNANATGTAASVRFDYLDVSVVPEPGALALAGIGGLLLVPRRRR